MLKLHKMLNNAGHARNEDDKHGIVQKSIGSEKNDSNKIFSLLEPHFQCMSKGKEHKKYEFGSKVSITTTKNTGVIIRVINIKKKFTTVKH